MKRFLRTIKTLRGPKGCPWDRSQTPRSMRRCLVEEAYEAVEAINRGDYRSLKEELGDVLCVVAMLSEMAKEKRKFSFQDVVDDIQKKLTRRHPHVFGDRRARSAEDALEFWTAVKENETGRPQRSVVKKPNRSYPSLLSAQKLGKQAARVGFDWNRPLDVLDKLDEELDELRRAVRRKNRKEIEEETGDLLFCIAQFARKFGFEGEMALHRANSKFIRRFRAMERAAERDGGDLRNEPLADLENRWKKSKSVVG